MYNTVLLDIYWNMLIKFGKQIANTFAKIINRYKGEFKTLSNIWDGAFSASSEYASELMFKVKDVSFLIHF